MAHRSGRLLEILVLGSRHREMSHWQMQLLSAVFFLSDKKWTT
jgi:hypothetical protein